MNIKATMIDAHCHLFNKEVLSWRLLIDYIRSRTLQTKQLTFLSGSRLDSVKRVVNFLKIGLSSTEDILIRY